MREKKAPIFKEPRASKRARKRAADDTMKAYA
jgi:hypothetical protein